MSSSSNWYMQIDSVAAEVKRHLQVRSPLSIDGYEQLTELRRGGQGVVYSGMQLSTRRRVAIKVLLDGAFASDSTRRRFEREIDLIAGLRHPNIVRLYDSGATPEGRMFFVMEYIDGYPLDDLFRSQQTADSADDSASVDSSVPTAALTPFESVRSSLALFAKICDAVAYAHHRGVSHRDLKPSNIRIDASGVPHVLDFGLAKDLRAGGEPDGPAISRTGDFMGSLPWASPEQVRGMPDDIDLRTDVYSLGVVLYQLLTGDFPYEVRGHFTDVARNILEVEPAPPSKKRPGLNDEIDAIVLTCLAKEPDRRYQSAAEIAADVRRYLSDEPILARRPSAIYQLRKFAKRNKALVGGATCAVVLLIAGIIGTSYGLVQANKQRRQALIDRDRAVAAEQQTAATNDFLNDMLRSADPGVMGRDATVREVLNLAAADVDRKFADSPEIRAKLHATLGNTYHGLGMYEESEIHTHKAYEARREVFGEDDQQTLASLVELGRVMVDRDRLDEAEELLTKAHDRAVALFGPNDQFTLHAASELGVLLHAIGRLDEANELLTATLAAQDERLGRGNSDTQYTMDYLSSVRADLGDYDQARELLEEVLAYQRAAHGDEHPFVISTVNDIAYLLSIGGKMKEAEKRYRDLLEISTRVLGPEHPATLTVMHNLATNLARQERFKEAEEIESRALEIREKVFGPDHFDTITAENTLAVIYSKEGRYDEAGALSRRVLDAHMRIRGPDHPETIVAMHNLAANLSAQGRLDEASDLFERSLAAWRKLYGNEHGRVVDGLNSLAVLRIDQCRFDEACDLLAEALDIATRIFPPDHFFIPWLRGNYGRALTDAGRYEEAETQLLEAYETYDANDGPEHSDTQWSLDLLIRLYDAWGRDDLVHRYAEMLIPESPDEPDAQPANDE